MTNDNDLIRRGDITLAFSNCHVYSEGNVTHLMGIINAIPAVNKNSALETYSAVEGNDECNPFERLRFFCSLAMSAQDWLDSERFFDDVIATPQDQSARIAGLEAQLARYACVGEVVGDSCDATGNAYWLFHPNEHFKCDLLTPINLFALKEEK
jgi:hypothetical protein